LEPVNLILNALAAGASTGLTESAASATKAAYEALKGLLRAKLHPARADLAALDEYEAQPEIWRPALSVALTDVGADRDEAILAAARKLLLLADPIGFQLSKYNITMHGTAQGTIIGDNANIVQNFD
jgi:hypothetical protein